jgi:hypothetical protein
MLNYFHQLSLTEQQQVHDRRRNQFLTTFTIQCCEGWVRVQRPPGKKDVVRAGKYQQVLGSCALGLGELFCWWDILLLRIKYRSTVLLAFGASLEMFFISKM